jgi:hypothetical protein
MMGRQDLRRGRIPEQATRTGDFVIDINDFLITPDFNSDSMVTANELVTNGTNTRLFRSDQLFPVYDAKNGMSLGNMKPRDFVKKMLGDL